MISDLGDQAVIISKNISTLLSEYFSYDQLFLDQHKDRRALCVAEMRACARRIKKAADNIYNQVEIINESNCN